MANRADLAPHRHIADPVHGRIELTKLETAVVDTPVFQRLRRVAHLGLASLVYPSANYTRFAHSLGTCHVATRIVQTLRRVAKNRPLTDGDEQVCRLAALLHDVGHFPLSHTTENAIQNAYRDSVTDSPKGPVAVQHEGVTCEIIRKDADLAAIWDEHGIDGEQIVREIEGSQSALLHAMVSSDLDADRIDYLLRTAHHTGLPYGRVDVGYLLDHAALDAAGRLAFRAKALRAAEHLLLCRYFDYCQVVYQADVVGFEWLLEDVVQYVLEQGTWRNLDKDSVYEMVAKGQWAAIDDMCLMAKISELRGDMGTPPHVQEKSKAIIDRHPPVLLGSAERIGQLRDGWLSDTKTGLDAMVDDLTRKLRIDRAFWKVWTRGQPWASVGGKTEEKQDSRWITILRSDGASEPIQEAPGSIMSVLGDRQLDMVRVYLLPPASTCDVEEARRFIGDYLNSRLGSA